MKETICTIAGVVGSFIAGLFGGWDASMVTLLLFMGVDYITGLAVAACGDFYFFDCNYSILSFIL